MQKILVSALAVSAMAAAGAMSGEARAESASGPLVLSPVQLDTVKGSGGDSNRGRRNVIVRQSASARGGNVTCRGGADCSGSGNAVALNLALVNTGDIDLP